jgi:hypothetical protein
MELRVGGKYRLSRKLGCGAFGDIYHGKSDFYFKRTKAGYRQASRFK